MHTASSKSSLSRLIINISKWICSQIYNTCICISTREVREFANGSVCLECDSQCDKMDGNAMTCLGQVRHSSIPFGRPHNQLPFHVTTLSRGRLFTFRLKPLFSFFLSYLVRAKVDFQLILWESIGLPRRISEDRSAVFAKVNGRLMGGMINYCGYRWRHGFGKRPHAHARTHARATAKRV